MKLIYEDKEISLIECKSFYSRLKGFMFTRGINKALLFDKCNSIHTFFMKKNIDVYMTDKNNKVLYIYKNLGKNKIILPKKNVYYTYEVPVNSISFKINDYIKIKD